MIADICVKNGQSVDQFNPIVHFRMTDGLSFNLVMPQVAINGPFVTIARSPVKLPWRKPFFWTTGNPIL
ncbi:MAG: hypothetical protein WCK35_18125 [Chloroflexota bacterium]